MLCPKCRHENPPRAKFCLECGTRLPVACRACGQALPETAKFCMECGAAVADAGAPHAPESYTPRHLAEKILASRAPSKVSASRSPSCSATWWARPALAERLGPEIMHLLLNRFFELALAEVHRYEGTINQFLGDGFMALFGAPIAHEDHARRAVLAALGLRRPLAASRPLARSPAVRSVSRSASGSTPAGSWSAASATTCEWTTRPSATPRNLAARLQQLAEPGAIVLSGTTGAHGRRARSSWSLEPTTEVKGKSSPVVASSRDRARRRGSDSLRRGCADAERLRRSRARAGRARSSCGRAGRGGRGQDDRASSARRASASRACCSSSAAERGPPHQLLRGSLPVVRRRDPVPARSLDMLRSATGIADVDPPETLAAKMERTLAALGITARRRSRYLLDCSASRKRPWPISRRQAVQTRTFELLRQIGLRRSQRRPRDLRDRGPALDRSNLGGVPLDAGRERRRRAHHARARRTGRAIGRRGWTSRTPRRSRSRAWRLRDSRSVVGRCWRAPGADDGVAAMILDKAEGNPFFLEELARAVAQQPDGQRPLGIPDTVHGVLTARIDRLPETPKRVLQTAAVLGRELTVRLLQAIWDGGPLRAAAGRAQALGVPLRAVGRRGADVRVRARAHAGTLRRRRSSPRAAVS